MLCIPLRLLEKSGMCEEEVAEYACRLMDTLCTTQVRAPYPFWGLTFEILFGFLGFNI